MIGLITWGQPSEATGSRHERGRRVWRPGGVRGDNKMVVRPALETVALTRKPEAGLEVVELKMLQPVCVLMHVKATEEYKKLSCLLVRRSLSYHLFVLLIKLSLLKVLSVLRSTCAAAQVAGLQHLIFMPVQPKASVPTCRLWYVATLQTLTGLSYCFLTKLRAICI